jgi:hypothetical protein
MRIHSISFLQFQSIPFRSGMGGGELKFRGNHREALCASPSATLCAPPMMICSLKYKSPSSEQRIDHFQLI